MCYAECKNITHSIRMLILMLWVMYYLELEYIELQVRNMITSPS